MVLLLCPRFPGDKDGEGYPPLAQSPSPRSSIDPASEERRMLQVIFNPSENQSVYPAETGSTSPGSTPPRLQLPRSKSGRARLELLSNKLRRRFSRDIRPAKLIAKPSDNPCEGASDAANGGIFQCTVTSADVLGIDTASDCGYDSDAHKLLTPQITARLKGSPCSLNSPHIMKRNLPGTSGLYFQGYYGAPGEIRAHTMNQSGFAVLDGPPLNFNDQSKPGKMHHTSDNPFFSDHPSKPLRSSRSASETLRHSFSDSTSSKQDPEPRIRNCFSYSSLYQPNISIQSDQNVRLRAPETFEFSFLGYVSSDQKAQKTPQHNISQANEDRNPESPANPYPTRPFSSPGSEILVNAVQERLDSPTEHEEASETSNTLESKDVPHDKDVPLYSCNRPKSPTHIPTNPVRSRFIENLDDVFSPRIRGQHLESTDHTQGRSKTRSSSDGWLSGGKRVGYGYSFIPETNGERPSTPDTRSRVPVFQPGISDYDPESPTCLTLKGQKLRGFEQERRVGHDLDQGRVNSAASPLQNSTVLKATTANGRHVRNQRSSSFPPWVKPAEQSHKEIDSSVTVPAQITTADANNLGGNRDSQNITATTNSTGNTFLKYLSRLSRANSLNIHRKTNKLDSHQCNQLDQANRKDTFIEPGENHSPDPPHGLQNRQNNTAEDRASGSAAKVSCGGVDSRMKRPIPLPTSGIYDRSLDDTDSEGSLTEGCSAEAWSRLYDDCVQFPSYYDRSTSVCSGLFTTAHDKTRDPTPSPMVEGRESATERNDPPLAARFGSRESVPIIETSWGNSVLQASGALHV